MDLRQVFYLPEAPSSYTLLLQAPTITSTRIQGLTASDNEPRSLNVSTKPLTVLLRLRLASH